MSDDQFQPSMRRLDRWQIAACYAIAAVSLGAGGVAVFTSDNGAGTVALFGVAALFSVSALNGALPSRIRAGDYEAELGRVTRIAYETGEEAGVQAVLDVATSAAESAGEPQVAQEIAERLAQYARVRTAHRSATAAMFEAVAERDRVKRVLNMQKDALAAISGDAEGDEELRPVIDRRRRQVEEAERRLSSAENEVTRLEKHAALVERELRLTEEGLPIEARANQDTPDRKL